MTGALLAVLFSAAAIEAGLAPDQPLPFVYADDPLVVELRSDAETQASMNLRVAAPQHAEAAERHIGKLLLRAGGVRWCAFKDLPGERGYYTAHIEIEAAGETHAFERRFCRIDRPSDRAPLPLCVHNAPDARAQAALASVGLRTLRIELDDAAALDEALAVAARGLRIVPVLRPALLEAAPDAIGRLAGAACDDILRWEIDPGGDAGMLAALSEAIKAVACGAPIAVVADTPRTLAALMHAGAGSFSREAVFLSDAPTATEVAAARRAIEQAGFEDWRIHVSGRGLPAGDPGDAVALTQRILMNFTMGVTETCFDGALVYDGALLEPLVYFNGLAARLSDTRFAGWIDLDRRLYAPLFRSGATWFLPLWAGEPLEVALELGDASAVRLTDALNNPLRLPGFGQPTMTLTAGPAPIYLTGVGGDLPAQAARTRAKSLAARFARSETFSAALPPALLDAAKAVAARPGGEGSRDAFFTLVRQLPELERAWHEGTLARGLAVPAIAQLARLARALCTVEQYRGEAFLEPLSDTLARCEEFQSLYLTGSTGASEAHVRGDWLLAEVRRLMDEARNLAAADRRIEAAALAALAEWRARCLDHAAKAGPLAEDESPADATLDPTDLALEERPQPDPKRK